MLFGKVLVGAEVFYHVIKDWPDHMLMKSADKDKLMEPYTHTNTQMYTRWMEMEVIFTSIQSDT